ncbi:hypothetical protein [Metabacillus fastidiosus]|uniref:Uncharacterized protein n=1 Tax=Metabacillus fastidiosus TaxID=1458 RepID=A0ABU6NT43_9BACI|nr:hypothetical protein [Metabacillus fastidiosus]
MTIKDLYISEMITHMASLGKKAKVTIDGVEKEFNIFKTLIKGKTFKHLIYLTNDIGKITDAKLLDIQGRELQTESFNVTKGPDGFTIVFVVTIEVKEG